MTPRATYRLQFSARFGFQDAAALAPYLAALGISHVYASPVFAARPGSTHGYDVTDPNRLNPELGSPADFRAMVDLFRAEGLGLVLDIVPNHMGIGGASNAFWLDVLEHGPESPHAGRFDIDWQSRYPGLEGKVLMPFLGDHYGRVLADGGLELRFDAGTGSFSVWAHDTHRLPVRPEDYAAILGAAPEARHLAAPFEAAQDRDGFQRARANLTAPDARAAVEAAVAAFRGQTGAPETWARLDALIARQHWRAARHTLAAEAIDYRRFFTISDLAGVRVEDPAVFDASHRLVLDLVDEGLVEGLRIDHIDGLRDPKAYCLRLRAAADRRFWLLVEKILAPDETLPADWQTDGTTGYEVANLLVGLLTDPAGTRALTRAYHAATGSDVPPDEIVHDAKRAIMDGPMAAETLALVDRLHAIARDDATSCDLGPQALRRALTEVVAALGVYRTYGDTEGMMDADRARIVRAVASARRRLPGEDPRAFDLIERVLTLPDLSDAAALEAVQRAQQLTGPVMAKGLEDTALYRYARLIALNEVGSEPGRFSVDPGAFHAANADRQAREPRAMLATSTHDTKRGEDARLRIAALAGRAEAWAGVLPDWRAQLDPEAGAVDPADVHFFFQLLLGVWPVAWRPDVALDRDALAGLAQRVEAAMLKSVREAGVHTRWVFGNPAYEAAVSALVGRALDPEGAFLARFRAFEAPLAEDGWRLALVQTVLKLTIPGVPDIYRGAEVWEQSLVDPDNRRPVDHAALAALLAAQREDGRPPAERSWTDGALKLATTTSLLDLRRRLPDVFTEGAYVPLPLAGPGGGDAVAFLRRADAGTVAVAAALRPARPPDAATTFAAPGLPGRWRDVLTGRRYDALDLAALLERLPAAVLVMEE